ncbi:prepilin-type N-terminal cleavage/methylation domain-containing protein [Vibrio sp. JC009]|uniref:type IV pilin protein n=1 Tax=Vibrio sp. JC009 TaxID=2912314 RepID=UPI0023B02A03|nr:type IV pilin protein [Vibrio sp. JC009]WED21303.1 prepilin-type N-terminal cleavage/methylation domain-containing protein [Vibrio sp. JC009]
MTLIELLVVLVIVGCLAVMGYPSYSKHGLKAHRTAAKSDLLKIQMELEQTFDRTNPAFTNGYNFDLIYESGSYCASSLNCQTEQGRFAFSIEPLTESGGYVLIANAREQQVEDSCPRLEVRSDGGMGPEGCW